VNNILTTQLCGHRELE